MSSGSDPKPIRVVVVDDHAVVRAGVVMVLGLEPNLEVVGEASNGREAVEQVATLRPDVVLMDLQMPELDGVDATTEILDQFPSIRILILTTYDTDQSIVRAVEAGAAGYLLKDAPPDQIIDAVKVAAAGGSVLPPEIAAKLMAKLSEPRVPDLTDRELDVLQCVAAGMTNAATAAELIISLATVKTHLIHVFQKLQVDDRTSAVTRALELELITLSK